MKFSRYCIGVLFFSLRFAGSISAGIVWETDLLPDPNTNSSPLASCVNEKADGIYVLTKTGPKGAFLHQEGQCILWEIGINGNIVRRILLKDANGTMIQTNALAVGYGCAMAADGLGNLITAGVLGEQRRERSLAVLSRTDRFPADPNMNISTGSRIDHYSIKKMFSRPNNTSALIGDREGNGFYLQIDSQGKILREVPFDMGQTEIFSGAATIKPDNLNLSIVGLSVRKSTGESKGYSVDNFILIYDPNDILLYEDYFTGDYPVLSIPLPNICCLDNGNIILAYYKSKEDFKSALKIKCYTKELQLLWEKEVFSTDKSYFSFDVVSYHSNGFAVAIPTLESLKLYFFNENGNQIGFFEYKGMVAASGFNLQQVGDKTIAVFEEGGPGRIKDITIKTKVMAFD